ncbi:MAG: sialate O-acetylesterase [Lentisphaeria bacterium]|nr:sialate O-acetylesterase [Lentisphaeria bacterium]
MRNWIILIFIFAMSATTFMARAAKSEPPALPRELAIEMGAPFNDGMILQRSMKLPVWGWSTPGDTITVEFAGQKKAATVDENGRWMLELDTLEASFDPRTMEVTSKIKNLKSEIRNVLVGEVWMCSGQSNMQFEAKETTVGWTLIPEIKARVEAGKERLPVIREVKVADKFSSIYPYPHAKGKWSSEWGGFSAVAFAFAYDIARETQVPVGIVNCSFSTTMIQAWTPREGFASGEDKYTRDIYQKILESDYITTQYKTAWEAFEKDIMAWGRESKERVEKGLQPKERPAVPGNMHGNRDATWMCNAKTIPMAPYAIRGAIWNQGYANINEGLVYRNNLHSLIRGLRAIWKNPELPVYFHQFYASGGASKTFSLVDSASEMRLATWLAHRDIPNAAMASQIDITGGVHYRSKTVPGQRLARHALKNQYGKDIIANGPMYRDYTVQGDKLILALDHAEGLFVGKTTPVKKSFPKVVKIENGDDQVELFYLADKDLVWYKAKMKIVGETIELTAPGLKAPRGVAYGRIIIGEKPSVYNQAILPLTPFVFYDHKLVVSRQWDLDYIAIPGFDSPEMMVWPMEYFNVAGEEVDPTTYGLQEEHRKLWLLSPQFAHNCVIQAGVPTRIYGKALPGSVVTVTFGPEETEHRTSNVQRSTSKSADHGPRTTDKQDLQPFPRNDLGGLRGKNHSTISTIHFEESVTMGAEQDEWEIALPAMEASAETKLLHVTCTLNGELAHERRITNVVVGDVWYVAANDLKVLPGAGVPKSGPAPLQAWDGRNPQLRMLNSFAQRLDAPMPSRFKLNSSGNPDSSLFARWSPPTGLTKELAQRIYARRGKPVGIVVFDPRKTTIKQWTAFEFLPKVAAWKKDYDELYPHYYPDPESFVTNGAQYLELWRTYWQKVKTDPSFESGELVAFPGVPPAETKATTVYNQLVCAFSPGNFKAILFLPSEQFVSGIEGSDFSEQFSVMANSWKAGFARGEKAIDPHFVTALPSRQLAADLSKPADIIGRGSVVEFSEWPYITNKRVDRDYETTVNDALLKILDEAVEKVYE